MSEKQEKIAFTSEDGEMFEFYILEQAKINGENYILVADDEEEEANALILKESAEESGEVIYDVIEDELELNAIAKVFEQMLDDIDIETNS